MYQAEVSTPESRGFMVSMHGIVRSYSLANNVPRLTIIDVRHGILAFGMDRLRLLLHDAVWQHFVFCMEISVGVPNFPRDSAAGFLPMVAILSKMAFGPRP